MGVFDIYALRPNFPREWPAPLQQWGAEVMRTGQASAAVPAANAFELPAELSTDAAANYWLPLRTMHLRYGDGDLIRAQWPEFTSDRDDPAVIVVWADGTLHMGVAPQRANDLPVLYRYARMVREVGFAEGLRLALRDYKPDAPAQLS